MKRESGDLMDQFIKNSGAVPAAVSPQYVSENTFATVSRVFGRWEGFQGQDKPEDLPQSK